MQLETNKERLKYAAQTAGNLAKEHELPSLYCYDFLNAIFFAVDIDEDLKEELRAICKTEYEKNHE